MEENQAGSSKKSIIVSVVVLAVVAGAFFFFLYRRDKQDSVPDLVENYRGIESAIPPSTNPFELTASEATPVEKTNPFKYENPFE